MISKVFLLIKQVRPATPQIDNLRTPIPILFQPRTLEAIKCIGDAFSTANYAFVLVVAERAFVADADKGCGAHVAVTNRTFAVAFVAQTAHGNARLFTAHDEIAKGKSV